MKDQKQGHRRGVNAVEFAGAGLARQRGAHVAWPGALLAAVVRDGAGRLQPRAAADASAGQPRGATVAFESIDGPPPGQFHKLVHDLNDEAQTRRLAVISRESPSAYRVRGYLAAKVVQKQTTISWVWDVFDQDDHRALRITGEETAKGRHRDAWAAADDDMLRRIAQRQHGAARRLPDLARGGAGHARRGRTPRRSWCSPDRTISRPKPPASSAYSSPMPTRCRAQADGARRRRERRPGAAAAQPAARGAAVSARDTLTLAASEPLSQALVHPAAKASGQ